MPDHVPETAYEDIWLYACPNVQCGRNFESWIALVGHLHSPNSTCKGAYEQVTNMVDQPPTTYRVEITPRKTSRPSQSGMDPTAPVTDWHPNPGADYGPAKNSFQKLEEDEYHKYRKSNPVYPFAYTSEWQLARFIAQSSLSETEIDDFLKLQWTKRNPPTFTSSHVLRSWIEKLPTGPTWRSTEICIPGYETKDPMILLWRDGLECIQFQYGNPVFDGYMTDTPFKRYTDSSRANREFHQFHSAEYAWEIKDKLPAGATLVGVKGASDKAQVTAGTGGLELHPAFLTTVNIDGEVLMKATSHAWMHTALIPIPVFLNVNSIYQAILAARVWHKCVDIFTARLKTAARYGWKMPDPRGRLRLAHTPLVGWVADQPEQLLIACTAKSASPVSTATMKDFGDTLAHPLRHGLDTLEQLRQLCLRVDPWDLHNFQEQAKLIDLSGVHLPFWRDWAFSDPAQFLIPEILHTIHKFFFDHPFVWCKELVGRDELDTRFRALHTRVGFRHFKGVSAVAQMTGRDHRDLARDIVPVIAGAVPDDFLACIRAWDDFSYQIQGHKVTEMDLKSILASLAEFELKDVVLSTGAWRGKNGPMADFCIPKLELQLNIPRSIRMSGSLPQSK